MYVELIGTLICPVGHEPTPLLAAVDRIDGRDVIVGTLACPACDTRYPIIDGVVVFDQERRSVERLRPAVQSHGGDDVMRTAALLDLTEPGGFVLASAGWAALAEPLADATGVAVVELNPAGPASGRGAVSPIYAGPLPLGRGALRGALLDVESPAEAIAAAVRPRGRLVGPVALAMPGGVRELARDEELWVAERLGDAPAFIPLRRSDVSQSLG